MKYIFHEEKEKGKLPIKEVHIAFYDMTRDDSCFDEVFLLPEHLDINTLTFIDTEENEGDSDRSRVFLNMKNGDVYELLAKKVTSKECYNFYGGR